MDITISLIFDDNDAIDVEGCTAAFNKKLEVLLQKQNKKSASGSKIAKSGFESENNIIEQFTDWKNSGTALEIVEQLCYLSSIDILNVEDVRAYLWKNFPLISDIEKKRKHKTDIFIIIKLRDEESNRIYSISQKRATIGFNQLDRRWVRKYQEVLSMPDDVARLLKLFTGELAPSEYNPLPTSLKDDRRLYMDELSIDDQNKVLTWFGNNAEAFLQFIFIGRRTVYPPNFVLIEKVSNDGLFYGIFKMDEVIQLYCGGKATLSADGNIYLGDTISKNIISVQRKGGDGGKNTAKNLQVKFNPLFALKTLSGKIKKEIND